MNMPLIACLGWGSLVWDHGDLPRTGEWLVDGPMIPVEFARQSTRGSSAGALTLVLVPGHTAVKSLWVPLKVDTAVEARAALGRRERIPEQNWQISIALWQDSDKDAPAIPEIANWARARDISALVWTALPPRFGDESDRVPTADEAVDYLRNLSGIQKQNAEQYVRKAPLQIDTPYRQRFIAELGWTPNGKI